MTKISTGERIMRLETKVEDLAAKIEEHCQDQARQFDEVKELIKDGLSSKANKWVEKFIYAIISGGALYFIYEVIKLIEK